MSYDNNITIAGLTLTINPQEYSPDRDKLGSFNRTIGGGLLELDMSGYKFKTTIRGIAADQFEQIKRRVSLNKAVTFIDYVPIAEHGEQTRTIYEDLGTETIDGETVYHYVPRYSVRIIDYKYTYRGAVREYSLVIEEV